MSNLLRGDSFALMDRPSPGSRALPPRIFGARVLRGEDVGMQRPMSLAAPVVPPTFDDQVLTELDGVPQVPARPGYDEVAEAARRQGYTIGFEQGRAAGVAAAETAMAQSVQRLQALANAAHENHATFFRAAERQVVDLALQIAQKVVEREVENMPDLAVNVIRAALEEMDARTAVRVRVSPDDEELLRRRWSQVVPTGVGADRIELQQDERVQSGGALIETTHGQVDAQLESKLAQLGNALWTFVMDVDNMHVAEGEAGSDA